MDGYSLNTIAGFIEHRVAGGTQEVATLDYEAPVDL